MPKVTVTHYTSATAAASYTAVDINFIVFIKDHKFNVRWLEINLLRQYYSWFNYKHG